MSDLVKRLRAGPYDRFDPRKDQELEDADYVEALEAGRDAVEKKLWGLSTQWALHGGPFDHAWISEVMAVFAPEQDK